MTVIELTTVIPIDIASWASLARLFGNYAGMSTTMYYESLTRIL
jgi:hypothetical protein